MVLISFNRLSAIWILIFASLAALAYGHRGRHGAHEDEKPRTQKGIDIEHEREHIKEHLEDVVPKREEEMTDEELHFHYFKLHDYNNDGKLDGCEIFKALSHDSRASDEEDKEEEVETSMKPVDVGQIADGVDEVLASYDANGDGYVTYPEYKSKMARRD